MKKAFFTIMILLVATTAFAMRQVENADEILNEMYENPSRYIRYGGASIGMTFYIDKASVNAEKYEPPQYIIAARKITHGGSGQGDEGIYDDRTLRYAYDYDERKMYVQAKGKDGKLGWKLIDPAKSKSYHDDNWVAAGEIMFYLAYNMSFYDKPATKAAQNVINGNPAFFRGIHS